MPIQYKIARVRLRRTLDNKIVSVSMLINGAVLIGDKQKGTNINYGLFVFFHSFKILYFAFLALFETLKKKVSSMIQIS